MTRRAVMIAFVCAIAVTGAAGAQATNASLKSGPTGLVRGRVVIAAGCPGPAQIGRSECAKHPVRSAIQVIVAPENDAGKDEVLTTIRTDRGGRFLLAIAPGSYRLVPISPSGLPGNKPVLITVTAGSNFTVELTVDTGLR
jgi:hypothetical protein